MDDKDDTMTGAGDGDEDLDSLADEESAEDAAAFRAAVDAAGGNPRDTAAGGPAVAEKPSAPAVQRAPGSAGPEGDNPPGAAVQTGPSTTWRIKVLYSNATELCEAPASLAPTVGSTVVVPTRYGNELGKVLGRESESAEPGAQLTVIARMASAADLSRVQENDMKEERAFGLCREKIEARGLEMKLVSAHYILDEQKILFLFTAENRVDFRELVKDLVAAFKMRIELRQIGVRDEARVIGGVGICGRALCCNSITDKLRPVSIKMAKEQNLTLNSMKISGPCGRLLCCLSYEFDVYREARQSLPTMGTRVQFEGEEFKVTDMNVLARRLRFQSESGRVLDVGFEALSRNAKTQSWELKIRTGAGGAQG
jgi:cell fate regulator YaaT (PSP1 superfamily)